MATDPRPELTADSDTWAKLLSLAYELDESDMDGAYGALLGIRCLGAQIGQVGGKWAIQHGEIAESEYQAIRQKYLLPNSDKIMDLIRRLA
jgi:hypothetical protein